MSLPTATTASVAARLDRLVCPAYQHSRRGQQRQAIKELASDAQDAGLYDVEPQTFEAALADARRKRA